ncbi:MAG: hypothetical protein HOG41_05525 [Gammaproteobacteria bacterium]|jgi:hypothetical protein|nr:hypothetical protein [Gammaproteobacteria bacterium]
MTHETSVFINNITNSLIQNYDQFPLDLESQLPKSSLEEMINHAGDKESEWLTSENNLHQFINGVTKLDCFTYRAVNQVDGKLVYWNALLQPFDDFKQTGTVIYQTDAPYPTADMIISWCNRQVL